MLYWASLLHYIFLPSPKITKESMFIIWSYGTNVVEMESCMETTHISLSLVQTLSSSVTPMLSIAPLSLLT